MEIKISVVIPTYQRPDLLVKCLDALSRQTFDRNSYEIIVVSDGPDMATEKLALTHPAVVKFLSTPTKKGPAAARNLGWQSAKGVLIVFTDDDCVPDASWLQAIWQHYQGEPEVAFTGRVVVPVSQPPTDYEQNVANLEVAEFVTANCICTRQALLKIGGFDEQFTIAWREDSDLHFKLLENNIPIHSKIPAIVVHPVRKAPWGVSIKEQRKGVFNALLYKKHPQLYRQRIKQGPSWNYYLMILLFICIFPALLLKLKWVAVGLLCAWFIMVLAFAKKRLARTSRSPGHMIEMVITSMLIPFLSVYWQLIGSFKYKVIML